jgi:hypothetical protein
MCDGLALPILWHDGSSMRLQLPMPTNVDKVRRT